MAAKTVWGTSAITGSPAISGTAGAMITALDALLVDGYGSITLDSLVVSGAVATATYSGGHTFPQFLVVEIAGVTDLTGLNGRKRIATAGATTFTFDATGVSDGTASGTITAKVPGAGWTKAYSGTNKAAYRNSTTTGLGMYLRVDDTGTTDSRVVGYVTMSNVDTGTDPFPTSAQISGGGYFRKSSAASATARDWVFISDERFFYISIFTDASSAYKITAFGDFVSISSGETTYDAILHCAATATGQSYVTYVDGSTASQKSYIPRAFSGVSGAVQSTKRGNGDYSNATNHDYPHPVAGGIICCTGVLIHEGASSTDARGTMPGYVEIHNNAAPAFNNGDRVEVSGLSSPMLLLKEGSGGSANGTMLGVLLGDWR